VLGEPWNRKRWSRKYDDAYFGSTRGAVPMTRQWDAGELAQLFPALGTSPSTSVRCVQRVVGQGRYIKEGQGGRHFGDLAVSASPAPELSVRLSHAWPSDLPPAEGRDLDRAILEGIVEGLLRALPRPIACAIRTENATYLRGDTTIMAVRIAASMAVQHLCSQPGWDGGASAPDVA
jgi:hypothetical protein